MEKKNYQILADALKTSGKTKADVVRATGLSYSLIGGFFNGYRNMSDANMSKIAEFLGINMGGN